MFAKNLILMTLAASAIALPVESIARNAGKLHNNAHYTFFFQCPSQNFSRKTVCAD